MVNDFSEVLKMMSKKENEDIGENLLKEVFKYECSKKEKRKIGK